jgi:hypothetical protein
MENKKLENKKLSEIDKELQQAEENLEGVRK